MSGANYDILAQGLIDKSPRENPQTTFWRSTPWKRNTRPSIESISQPFNTNTNFGQESQVLLNRVGDMVYFLYVHVTLPGLVACDTKTENCAGIAAGGQFPVFMDGGAACNPCAKMDEAALLEYLPSDYNDMSADQQAEALKTPIRLAPREDTAPVASSRAAWRATPTAPTSVCPELGDTWCHYLQRHGSLRYQQGELIIGGQQVDQLWGTFLFCWEELTGKSGRRLTELTGRRYTRSQLICDSREERDLYIPLPF